MQTLGLWRLFLEVAFCFWRLSNRQLLRTRATFLAAKNGGPTDASRFFNCRSLPLMDSCRIVQYHELCICSIHIPHREVKKGWPFWRKGPKRTSWPWIPNSRLQLPTLVRESGEKNSQREADIHSNDTTLVCQSAMLLASHHLIVIGIIKKRLMMWQEKSLLLSRYIHPDQLTRQSQIEIKHDQTQTRAKLQSIHHESRERRSLA